MVSFFWQRGFYFNRRFFFFSELSFFQLRRIFGLSQLFWRFFLKRCDGWGGSLVPTSGRPVLCYTARSRSLEDLIPTYRFVLTHLLIRLYPVLQIIRDQYRLNVVFYFFIRTYRGFALRFNRPLRRRTRGRTYYRRHLAKPPARHYQRVATSRWF
uniref:ribosomal protein S13 n=1 Tax=Euplotes cristatus TaxID=756077 RepID=UPI002E7A6C8F|nr:ribosomal protein S13 [Euplotes cristatus]UPM52073.1 ribosomal protein S13 [Euplotes cristatus]